MKRILNIFMAILAIASCQGISAQTSGLKIVSAHIDLKMKVIRCEALGTTVYIDFVVENVSDSDVDLSIGAGEVDALRGSVAYDDEGNVFTGTRFKVKLGGSALKSATSVSQTLPSEVPIKGRIQIEGVPESAQMLKRVDIWVYSRRLGISTDKRLKLMNVPISREGDE